MTTDAHDLSPRIRAVIRAQERRNEILISWVQAGFVALLAVLYFISPRAFHDAVPVEPVPIILAFYAPFILLRLVLSHLGWLNAFFVSLSILVDVLVLGALIWSFHLQYQQPPPFYLKAPTFAYFFIFVALRSLRYDARYVLLTGFAAMGMWLLLLWYALSRSDTEITRDFVQYIMGYHVLLGAEVDKLVSIGVVTAILTIGVVRSRRLLAVAAYDAQARRDLTRFFSPDVAQKILSSDNPIHAGEGEIRQAATLMMDIRGFTKLAARETPNAVMKILADYQKRMVAEIFRHSGTIDKFMGDGIMAHFGAATSSETYAADALRAVEALARAAESWAEEPDHPPLGFGIACASGQTIFGAVGDEERLEYTLIGDAVNLSAKLEKHTKVLEVRGLTTRGTYEAALQQGYTPSRPPRELRAQRVEGVAEPVDLVVLDEGPSSPVRSQTEASN
jgi:adenylate cyclase